MTVKFNDPTFQTRDLRYRRDRNMSHPALERDTLFRTCNALRDKPDSCERYDCRDEPDGKNMARSVIFYELDLVRCIRPQPVGDHYAKNDDDRPLC